MQHPRRPRKPREMVNILCHRICANANTSSHGMTSSNTLLRHHIWVIILSPLHRRHASHRGDVSSCFRRRHPPSPTLSTPIPAPPHLLLASLCCRAPIHSLPASFHRPPHRFSLSSIRGADASPSGDVTSIGVCVRPFHTHPFLPPPSLLLVAATTNTEWEMVHYFPFIFAEEKEKTEKRRTEK